MRLAIVNWTGGGMSGGYRAYLHNVLPRLATHSEVEYVHCMGPATLELPALFSDESLPRVSFSSCHPFRIIGPRSSRSLTAQLQTFRPDVVFVPVERCLTYPDAPVVSMVQNMGPLIPTRWKNPWSERVRYVGQRMEARRAVRAAAHVIAPTAFVKEFLVRAWDIPDHRVSVLHYGAALPVHGGVQRPLTIPEAWRNSFVFTAGSIEPYRGLEDALGSVALLREQGIPTRLVIAGSTRENMRSYERRLRRWVERRGLTECVRWVGHLSTQEMAWCYTSCSIFIMTSRVETFAIIGAEALVYGCVCVVAENPPFPEVFDGAATYYTPGNSASLVAAIRAVMRWSPAERMQASERAKQRAASFSWDTHVQRLVRCFAML